MRPPRLIIRKRSNSLADIEYIKEVVQGYMKTPRYIILAVVSVKNSLCILALWISGKGSPAHNKRGSTLDNLVDWHKTRAQFSAHSS